MATELAKAYIQILPTTKGIKSNLEKEMGDAGASAGKSAGGKIGSMIKGTIAAAGIGTALKQAVTEGMELEQNLGGTEAVFGKFAQTIQTEAATAYKNMGLSASDYMATANKMGSLFQGSGLEQQKALNLTSQAMQRAADVASVMGLDMEMAMESIAGAAKGNFTMMDNLGVAMNATTIEAYALEKGINFEWKTASNAEKAEVAMQMFFERTNQYAGNFARESAETLSGSFGAAKSALQNLLGDLALGNDIKPSLDALGESVVNLVSKNLLPMVSRILTALPNALSTALIALTPVLMVTLTSFVSEILGTLPSLVDAGFQIISIIASSLSASLPTLLSEAVKIAFWIGQALIDGIPTLIEAAKSLFMGIVAAIPEIAQVLSDNLPDLINTIVYGLGGALPDILNAAVGAFSGIIQAIPLILPPLLENLPYIITEIVGFLAGSVGLLVDAAVMLLNSIIDAIPLIIPPLISELPTIISSIISSLIKATPQIIKASVSLFMGIVKAIPKVLSELLKAAGGLGKSLVQGLWNGIKDTTGWVLEKIKGFGKSVLNGIKDIFGIHSPATTTTWMGEMLDEGLGRGIDRNTKPVRKAIDNITRMTTGTLESRLSVDTVLGVSSAPSSADNDKIDTIIVIMSEFKKSLENMRVILDSGAVVGGISTKMDEALGVNNSFAERGVAL